jgi:hypothetical protein
LKLVPRVWMLAGLFVLGLLGLIAPGLAGQIGLYAWLGVFPGLAISSLLLPRASDATRVTLGLAFSPLVSALAACALLAANLDLLTVSRLIGVGGWVLYTGAEARHLGRPAEEPSAAPMLDRFAWGWLLACAVFVALPPLFNAFVRIRVDTWVHGALVYEIAHHGVPPVDPRFIGMHLNYVWFYNLFQAQLTVLRGQDPFVFMAIQNVVDLALVIAVVWQLAWAMWGTARAAKGTLLLFVLGLNAGAWMLWPLNLLRALHGQVQGAAEMKRIMADTRLAGTDILYVLSAPFAHMVNFWDKFSLGTPIGYAYLLMLVMWWALARALAGEGVRWLFVAALAAAGQQLFHGVVGMSVIPVATGALILAALLRARWAWLPHPKRMAAFGVAMLAGFAACGPYTRSISAGWDQHKSGLQHSFFHLDWQMPWTVATACGVAGVLALASLRRVASEQRAFAAWLACWALGMFAFAMVVHLPESNEHKFVWPLFAALALLGGAVFLDALDAARARFGSLATNVIFALWFVVPQAAFLQGYLVDPASATAEALHPRPGEMALYRWMQDSTRTDVVFMDANNRDLVNVLGQRRLLAGTLFGSERAAFPAAELAERRAVEADLYGPVAHVDADLDTLGRMVADARRLHSVSDVLVLYRASDDTAGAAPWARLQQAAGTRASVRYDRGGFRVYALKVDQ